jgi:iron-sulfur cluster insertion protein
MATLTVSQAAADQIQSISTNKGYTKHRLRIEVQSGGCYGFQYNFTFDDTIGEEDILITDKGVTLVVDTVSLDLLDGSELTYVSQMIGAAFQINNPKATDACGCGNSFSV